MPVLWDTQDIQGNVTISLSRDGGKSFEVIETTENDGNYEWTVAGSDSVNCLLKIEPSDNPSKGTTLGVFTICASGGSLYKELIKCYNKTGEFSCPQSGEDFYDQDGSYTINPPSYTKLDAQGNDIPSDSAAWVMVRDNITGLVWEVKTDDESIHGKDKTYPWEDAQEDAQNISIDEFIAELNRTNFGGFSDWRLPTARELASILNFGKYADTEYFANTAVSYYWSSHGLDGTAWAVSFFEGTEKRLNKSADYVRAIAVRGGKGVTPGHLVDNSDETVTDTDTGLMWKKEHSSLRKWQDALKDCEDLKFAGYTDWRLPNIAELRSVVNYGDDPDTEIFPYKPYKQIWSSTTFSNKASYVLYVNQGTESYIKYKFDDDTGGYIHAVRGGQNQVPGHLIISVPAQASTWNVGNVIPITWNTQDIAGNVEISVSREGGKDGTFETIAESTENDGSYEWPVTGNGSSNCVLKIKPLNDFSKGTEQGLFTIAGTTSSGRIPDTGQTQCYNDAGGKISCPQFGEDFYGQDANYTINPPSYTKLDDQGNDLSDLATQWVMIRDNVTGLIWEAKTHDGSVHDMGNLYTWCDSNPETNGGDPGTCEEGTDTESFIQELNNSRFGGFSDWRLPEIKKLASLSDMNAYFPFTNNTEPYSYWSHTTSAKYPLSAWRINFRYDGSCSYNAKSEKLYVRAVRGGHSEASVRLLDNGDGTVTDAFTGLMWQQETPDFMKNWNDALAYGENLSLAGYADWRLPNEEELRSVADYGRYTPAIDTDYFEDTATFSYYWSSTTYNISSASEWCFSFNEGHNYLNVSRNFVSNL